MDVPKNKNVNVPKIVLTNCFLKSSKFEKTPLLRFADKFDPNNTVKKIVSEYATRINANENGGVSTVCVFCKKKKKSRKKVEKSRKKKKSKKKEYP